MPISPKECVDNFAEKDKAELDRLQKTIDVKLLAGYHGQGTIVITLYETINERVKKRITKNYNEAGWFDIQFKHESSNDQRDHFVSTIITFTHTPKTSYFDR